MKKTKNACDVYLKPHNHYLRLLLLSWGPQVNERNTRHNKYEIRKTTERAKQKTQRNETRRNETKVRAVFSSFHFTSASLSKRAKSSFNIFTRSWAL